MTDEQKKTMNEVTQKLKEINDLDILEQYLKDNVNEFLFNEKHYRVHKPNPLEKELANKERMKKYFSMLKDDAYMFRKDLVTLYKKKGIDIESFDQEAKNLALNEHDLLKKLSTSQDKDDIELLEKEILSIREAQQELFIEKEELLKYCIEKQLEDFLKFFLVYLVLEVKKEDKWEKVYKTFEEFMTSEEELLQAKAAQVFAVMIFHENL